ncbi:MAG TPA: V-type ATP synthase subunit B [Longimicrobiales bacterium]
MNTLSRIYRGAESGSGPLLFLRNTPRVALGESVLIENDDGQVLRGQVLEAGDTATVIQVLDDTLGLTISGAVLRMQGQVAEAIVGRELLGRAFSGAGTPVDGLPMPVGEDLRPVAGAPINPASRLPPSEFIETGISAIDGLNTLVRGQKLPVFAGPGLPAMSLAANVVEWAGVRDQAPFAVVFVGLGITARERQLLLQRFERIGALERAVMYFNEAGDPPIERLLAPRLGLTAAEFLAYDCGMHVLVVMADMTNYCDALREIATARSDIPGRRGYPGYMYTDLASLFERAGRVRGHDGSLTQLPVVTMPDDDITHPIPDLTGYITEGQIVLSRELHRRGVHPPIDVLPSLSRLMNAGIGAQKTSDYHRQWANQLYASYARGVEARLTAAIVGEEGLDEMDRRALHFADRFERELIGQSQRRTIEETFNCGWRLLSTLPRHDLQALKEEVWRQHCQSEDSHA